MRIIRKILVFMLVMVLLYPLPIYAAKDTNIEVNGYSTNIKGIVVDGVTMVPVRALGDILGLEVLWDQKTKAVTLINGADVIKMKDNEPKININGKTYKTNDKIKIVNKRTMAPLRDISENLDLFVDWDNREKKVTISNYKNTKGAVFITRTGGKYHKQKCNGGRFILSTLTKAKRKNLKPCNVCY